jgi:hypothetical protein
VQSRLIPVLYERAIECAASERRAAIWQVLKLPYVDLAGLPRSSGR